MTIYRVYHHSEAGEGQSDFAHKQGAVNHVLFWSKMYNDFHWYIKRITS